MVAAAVPDAVALIPTLPAREGRARHSQGAGPYLKRCCRGRIRTDDSLFTNQKAVELSLRFWLSMYS